jgi:trans-aconitate 2-methyltransferase
MWDPGTYLSFGDLRARPFHDLVARIGAVRPRRVVDLGCGPGNLTSALAERWPGAVVEAIDRSPEMVAAARQAGIDAELGDVRGWVPADDTGVVVSNAVLQWVPEHRELLRRWVRQLPAGAWLAMQVPGNFDAPSHRVVRQLAEEPGWAALLGAGVPLDEDAVASPREYADLLADEGCAVDAWETTYLQRLDGPDPVLNWISGTALRPVRAALDDESWQRFRARLAVLLAEAYPARADGTTWFPFRRVFVVARTADADPRQG